MEKKDVRFTIDLPIDLHQKIKVLCVTRRVSMRKVVVDLLEKWASNFKDDSRGD